MSLVPLLDSVMPTFPGVTVVLSLSSSNLIQWCLLCPVLSPVVRLISIIARNGVWIRVSTWELPVDVLIWDDNIVHEQRLQNGFCSVPSEKPRMKEYSDFCRHCGALVKANHLKRVEL